MKYETIEFQAQGRTIRMCDNGGVMARHYHKGIFYEPHMLDYIRSLELTGTYVDVGAAGYRRTGRQWNASPTFEWRPA